MKALLVTATILTGALLAGGCATKKYVRNTTAPIQAKVDQVGDQTAQNSKNIQDTRDQVKQVDDRATTGISGANERADAASQKAGDAQTAASNAQTSANGAMTTAQQADQKGTQNSEAINGLRGQIANLDDYKLQSSVAVPFKFGKYVLTTESQDQLDKLAQDIQSDKRFFVAVEGYTDTVGSKEYNEALSRKRADTVVEYLVAKHDVPIYRIHMIGLGEQKPVDDAKTREARAKNRRVEVKVFSADAGVQSTTTSGGNGNTAMATGK
jgi:OOP family OmpA-OmpF porin